MAEQTGKQGDVAPETTVEKGANDEASGVADGKTNGRIRMDVTEGMETGMRGELALTPGETELCEKVLSVLEAGVQKLGDIARMLGVPPGWVEDAILALEGDGLVSTNGVPGPLSGISAVLTNAGRHLVERTRFKDAEAREFAEERGKHG